MDNRRVQIRPPWVSWEQKDLEDKSTDDRIPMIWRLFTLILSRMNDDGHAPFDPGEVRRLLADIDMETGELTLMPERTLRRLRLKLVEWGFLTKDCYGEVCFVVTQAIDRKGVKVTRCIHSPPKPRRVRKKTWKP